MEELVRFVQQLQQSEQQQQPQPQQEQQQQQHWQQRHHPPAQHQPRQQQRQGSGADVDGEAAERAQQRLLRQAEQVAEQVATHPNWRRKLQQLSSCEPPCPCAKDPALAAQERQQGNECFAAAQYVKALQHYTLALRHSPQPPRVQQQQKPPPRADKGTDKEEDKDSAAARRSCSSLHANRAACLLALQRWRAAAAECTEALQLWRGNSKALFRRAKAWAALGQANKASKDLIELSRLEPNSARIRKELQQEIKALRKGVGNEEKRGATPRQPQHGHQQSSSTSSTLWVHQCVACQHTIGKGGGRGLFVAKQMCDGNDEVDSDDESDFEEDERWMPDTPVTVASGDLVLQEAAPFAGILLKSQREKRCHACFRELGVHRRECGGSSWAAVLPQDAVLALRLAVKSRLWKEPGIEPQNGSKTAAPPEALEVKQVPAVDSLIWHANCIADEERIWMLVVASVVAACFHRSRRTSPMEADIVHDDAMENISALDVVRWWCVIRVNGIHLVSIVRDDKPSFGTEDFQSITEERYGLAVYPFTAMLNHSCAPNCTLSFCEGMQLAVRATVDVKHREELCISYGPQQGEWLTAKRRQHLLDQYGFACECSACNSLQVQTNELYMNALRCRKEHCNGAVIGLPARCCTCGATVNTIEGGDDVIAYVEKLQSSVAAACKTGQLLVAEQHVRALEELLHPYNRHFAQILDAVAHAFAEVGRFTEAAELVQRSLVVLQRHYPPQSVQLAHEMAKLAALHVRAGQLLAAQRLQRCSDHIFRCHYGTGSGKNLQHAQLEEVPVQHWQQEQYVEG